MDNKNYYKNKKYGVSGYRVNAILSMVNGDDLKVLDIGCSSGQMGALIKSKIKNSEVYGVDLSKASILKARKGIDYATELNVSLGIDDWPEEIVKQRYDYIIISEVLEHLFDPNKLLDIAKCLLKSDGYIIITIPNILFWINRIKLLLGRWKYTSDGLMDEGHIRFFSWKSFNELLNDTFLEVVENKNKITLKRMKFIGKLFPGLFAYQFIVKLKK